MEKVLKFDNTIQNRLKRAREALEAADEVEAAARLNDALAFDSDNIEAHRIYAELYRGIAIYDAANAHCFKLLSLGEKNDSVHGIITDYLSTGKFNLARYYNEKNNADYDFSKFIGDAEESFSDDLSDGIADELSEAEIRRSKFKIISHGNDEKSDGDEFSLEDEFKKLLIGIGIADDADDTNKPRKLKLAYPKTKSECADIINRGMQCFMTENYAAAIEIFDEIPKKNFKHFAEAQKYKAFCYLALRKYKEMLDCVEETLKYFPDDFTMICYRVIALKNTAGEQAAERAFDEVEKKEVTELSDIINKLDVCVLLSKHEEILKLAGAALDELPFNGVFWLRYAKAQYNVGARESALYSFKSLLKLYPDLWEAEALIREVNRNVDVLDYGNSAEVLYYARTVDEVERCILSGEADFKRFSESKRGKRLLKFALSYYPDGGRKAVQLAEAVGEYRTKFAAEVFKELMLDDGVLPYVKKIGVETAVLTGCSDAVKLVVGGLYKEYDFTIKFSAKTPLSTIEAYAVAFAEIIIKELHYEKRLAVLKSAFSEFSQRLDTLEPALIVPLAALKNADCLAAVFLCECGLRNAGKAKKEFKSFDEYREIVKKLENDEYAND